MGSLAQIGTVITRGRQTDRQTDSLADEIRLDVVRLGKCGLFFCRYYFYLNTKDTLENFTNAACGVSTNERFTATGQP